MSEAVAIAIMSAEGGLIVILLGWLIAHERRCADKWARHMEEYGGIKARVESLMQRGNSR